MAARNGGESEQSSVRAAGLRYYTDSRPGIRRLRCGRGFSYVGPDGARLTDRSEIERIRRLAVPPAWTGVWISPHADSHLLATGRDARRRKQYRYHPEWRRVRDADKFDRLASFGAALPAIRRRVRRDLARDGLPRQKVLAAIVRLLETSLIRVGNESYARNNHSYGLTTLLDRHVRAGKKTLRFRFRGKGGQRSHIEVSDPRLARIVRRCQELPGQQLFCYMNGSGEPAEVDSGDVNEYLREISGGEFTAKDFRTWVATVEAARELAGLDPAQSAREVRAGINRAVETVAERLGNTATICRKCYIHPAVLERGPGWNGAPPGGRTPRELKRYERAVLRLLKRPGRRGRGAATQAARTTPGR